MARMRSDTDRGMMLRKMLDDMYGQEGGEGSGVPAMPPAGGGRLQDEEQVANSRAPIDPQGDADYEKMYGDQDDDDLPPFSEDRVPSKNLPPADPRMNQAGGEEMVPVPKSIVKNVMAAMMRAGSRNSIGKSMGADGSGDTGFPHNRSMSEEPVLPKEPLPRGYQEDDMQRRRRSA